MGYVSYVSNEVRSQGIVRVGTSGWIYAPWRGVFYPRGLRREEELSFTASHLRAVEINGTFYGMQKPETFEGWARQVPADFVFAVRAPRFITHIQRLRDADVALAHFFGSGLMRLGVHLGPILWQFPANFRYDPKRLEPFLSMLPQDSFAAIELGRRHDSTAPAPPWLEIESRRPLRHAVQIGHTSFRCRDFVELLRAYGVALVCADTAEDPPLMDVTSDFVYCRLQHGDAAHDGGYTNVILERWARRINAWSRGDEPEDGDRVGGKARVRRRDVFVFFDNDKKVRAPVNAMELIRRLRP